MTRSMFSDDPILLVNAYLDGELDPANALAIEQRMAADSALAAEYTRIGLCSDYCANGCPAKLRCRVCALASRHPPA